MSRGMHLSLEEVRKSGKLKRFAKEHPAVGGAEQFERLVKAMAPPVPQPKKPKDEKPGQ